MTIDSVTGPMEAEKDSAFICDRCRARCTESSIDGTEYGHTGGCPRRDIDRAVNTGVSYDPEKDDQLLDQPAVADGGDGRVE